MKITCKNTECNSFAEDDGWKDCLQSKFALCYCEYERQILALQQELQEKKEALKEIAECCSGRERMKQIAWEAIKELDDEYTKCV